MSKNDLISRAAAIDAIVSVSAFSDAEYIKNLCKNPANSEDWFGGVCDAINAVEDVNAVDAAPVVRCMDCKNWDNSTEGRYVGGWCFCEKLQFSTSPDWFCADGERVDAQTCGPDYCEIGGKDDADGETPLSR